MMFFPYLIAGPALLILQKLLSSGNTVKLLVLSNMTEFQMSIRISSERNFYTAGKIVK